MIKEIGIDELLTGKAIQRGSSTFPKTADIVLPFMSSLDRVTKDWKIKVAVPTTISIEENTHDDMTEINPDTMFYRVLIQAVLNDEYQLISTPGDSYSKVVGMVYALDVMKPVIKVYSGGLRDACINLSIFSKNAVQYRHFTDEDFSAIYETIPGYLDGILEERVDFQQKIDFLNREVLEGTRLKQELGNLAVQCIAKNKSMTSHFTAAVNMLYNKADHGGIKNNYFNSDGRHTRYNIWNALTANITEKADPVNAPNLVYKAYSLFEN